MYQGFDFERAEKRVAVMQEWRKYADWWGFDIIGWQFSGDYAVPIFFQFTIPPQVCKHLEAAQ